MAKDDPARDRLIGALYTAMPHYLEDGTPVAEVARARMATAAVDALHPRPTHPWQAAILRGMATGLILVVARRYGLDAGLLALAAGVCLLLAGHLDPDDR